ncbi:hypothetical protein CEXT_703621 [Caerostris extrusa]|uniref:Uncharacterized protein n=1 Tax=Caerostris extrusa TaxID=172846 RepID=A0AAV4MZW3_CAEEX|nr:hypothetical protein CEXT_703621 [Caerostris extrusa]
MGSQTSSNCAEVTLRLPLLNREEGSPSTTTQEVKERERERDQCFATQLFTNIRYDSVPTLKLLSRPYDLGENSSIGSPDCHLSRAP